MNFEEITNALPLQPRRGMVDWAMEHFKYSDLGGEFLIFQRISIEIEPELLQTMTRADFERHEKETLHRWAAECRCTACGQEFITGYENKNGLIGIKMFQGEDGQLYDGYCPPEYDNYDSIYLNSGTDANCPYCDAKVEVKRKAKLGEGRLYQLLVTSVEECGEYAAVVTWLLSRRLNRYMQFNNVQVIPRSATVIGKNGKRYLFRKTETHFEKDRPLPEWKYTSHYSDPMYSKYHSYEAYSHRKIGSAVWKSVPDLTGTTGEKTGIADYVQKGGSYPNSYIKLWKKHPQLENIVKSSYADILLSGIEHQVDEHLQYYGSEFKDINLDFLDLNEVKPHKILHLTKEEYRKGIGIMWNWEYMLHWMYHDWYINDMYATEFEECCQLIGLDGVTMIDGQTLNGDDEFDLKQTIRYLMKQTRNPNQPAFPLNEAIQYLIDYREQLYIQYGADLTQEQLWPTNLIQAHDRIMEQQRILTDKKQAENFARIADKYAPISWTDGDLCIRVARSNEELVAEGDILRHCVGGYGSSHLKEKDVIFFVRRYRRPERSYYTLDIRFDDVKKGAYEVQLHGYGNERHGTNKQYVHTIPKKVRAFVDRWKKEVMLPWYMEQRKELKKNGTKRNNPAA